MMLMRRFEEKCGQLYTMQKFGGFCHLYIGQEAILAGMITAIRTTDRLITGLPRPLRIRWCWALPRRT